jgi:DNA ligase-associated metallophosphoesterase
MRCAAIPESFVRLYTLHHPMTPAPLHFFRERLLLDPAGALVWPEQHLLVIADLHLEKGSAAARQGQLVPPWDTGLTLERLARLIRRYQPRVLIALGDSFHDRGGAARMAHGEASRLAHMTSQTRFIWVLGNHDPVAQGVGGEWVETFQLGPLSFRHEADPAGPGDICGHHHPKATVPTRGANLTRPCFVVDAKRIMLPAFGAYTGGLDVRDPAISALFPRGFRAFLLGQDRLFSFAMSGGPRRAPRRPPASNPRVAP